MTNYVPVFFDIETTGFNPLHQKYFGDTDYGARVTAIGIGTMDDAWKNGAEYEDCEPDVDVLWDESEYRLLEVAHDRLQGIVAFYEDEGYDPFLVTFNGRNYDHPYLGARYARLRLDGSWWNHKLKRLDMMRALGKRMTGVSRYPSEDDCLEAVGIESEDEYDGSDMPDFYEDGEWDKIESHCHDDVEEMMMLFCEEPEFCMEEFYEHYNVDADAAFEEEVEF